MTNDIHSGRKEKIAAFDPDTNGLSAHGIFGLPFTPGEAQVVLLPVPWETTVSYGTGTAEGPQAIFHASQQLDLNDPIYPGGWKAGFAMVEQSGTLMEQAKFWRSQADLYLREFASADTVSPQAQQILQNANQACDELRNWVKTETGKLLDQGKCRPWLSGMKALPSCR